MLDVLFYLLVNALFFLGVVAIVTVLFLPVVKLFEKKGGKARHGEKCAAC